MGENEAVMARRVSPLGRLPARLLVPRAPFPVELRRRDRTRIGHAWYQYDGDEDRFVASMEHTRRYLFPLIDRVCGLSSGERSGGGPFPGVFLVGFSQGAYLAYYLALRHPDRFQGVIGVAGRPKDEVLGPHLEAAREVRVLHLHGASDEVVSADACRDSVAVLAAAGLDAHFRLVPGAHEVSPEMQEVMGEWLRKWQADDT